MIYYKIFNLISDNKIKLFIFNNRKTLILKLKIRLKLSATYCSKLNNWIKEINPSFE